MPVNFAVSIKATCTGGDYDWYAGAAISSGDVEATSLELLWHP